MTGQVSFTITPDDDLDDGDDLAERTVALRQTIEHLDDRNSISDTKVNALFDLVDTDGSGQISRDEMKKMYSVVKGNAAASRANAGGTAWILRPCALYPASRPSTLDSRNDADQIHAEHVKEDTLAQGQKRAKQRAKLFACVSGVLVILVSVLLGGNAALVYALLEATKEVKLGPNSTLMGAGTGNQPVRVVSADSHPENGRLIDSNSSLIMQTAPAMERIPMRLAPLLSFEMLNQVTTIMLRRDPGGAGADGGPSETWVEAYKIRK